MEFFDRLAAQRRRRAHRRHQLEQARQRALQGRDAQQAVKDIVRRAGPGSTGHNS